jgi:hypothetical protein
MFEHFASRKQKTRPICRVALDAKTSHEAFIVFPPKIGRYDA